MELKGVFTAIVTPFKNGNIDYESYESLIEKQIEAGVSGIVPCGTTGESPTLSHSEHQEFISKTVELVKGRIKVIAGTGSNSTEEAIHLTRDAERSGADGALLVNPYYNKPTQEGLYRHFYSIAQNTGIECILYNIPGRTSIALELDTVKRLAEVKNIIGIKEASGNINFASQIKSSCQDQLAIFSGDDSLTLPLISIGGSGVVSVLSNVLPADMKHFVQAALLGDFTKAKAEHLRLFPLMQAMFLETNPIPVKASLGMLGWIQNELRLPLTELSEKHVSILRQMLQKYNLSVK